MNLKPGITPRLETVKQALSKYCHDCKLVQTSQKITREHFNINKILKYTILLKVKVFFDLVIQDLLSYIYIKY